MVGVNIVGVGIGFLLPTLVVYDDLPVDESQTIIVRLYIVYFILAAIQVVLGLVFMRPKPAIAPSISAEK